VAAVLNKYYSFTNPFGTEWTIWYLRESYTALLCANLPLIYPLIQRVFRLRSWSSGAYETSNQYRLNSNPTRPRLVQHTWERQKPKATHQSHHRSIHRSESQEIIGPSVDVERNNGAHFITSAIDIDDLKSPGMESSASFKSGDTNKRDSSPHHAI
jgi:hypothetical protein